ncbi:MAG: hypothetical protein K0S65_5138 [Labilithrix sp.]|nr:hypothetical protein [Labilithrix sp.]
MNQSNLLGVGGPRRSLVAGCMALALLGLTAYVLPKGSRNPLWETATWAILVITSFIGWGSLVRLAIARHARVDLGLRAAWGASLVCFLGGLLMVPALMTRTAALALVDVGLLLAFVSLIRERSTIHFHARYLGRLVKREPRLTVIAAIVLLLIVIQFLGGIADWHTNPYDDDIAYLAFVKKLSNTGNVVEPFSFRRLSTFGGQTLFLELISVRADPSQSHTFDRSV